MVIYYYQDFNHGIKYSMANKELAAEKRFFYDSFLRGAE